MYSNIHGVAGAAIVVGTYRLTGDTGAALAIGGWFAFLSHDPLDRLGEKSYGGMRKTVVFEAIPLAIFAYCAWLSGIPWLFAAGWIAGNGMDLIDKKLYLAMFFSKRFKVLDWFACHRRKPDIAFTYKQTVAATIAASAFTYISVQWAF